MKKFDRIFNGDDVVVLSLIDQVDNRREGGTLPAAGRSRYQHDPVFDVNNLFQLSGRLKSLNFGGCIGITRITIA